MKKRYFLAFLFSLFIMFEIGNLSNDIVYGATMLQKLAIPEDGWNRYDDCNSNIKYIGNWNIIDNNSYRYNKTTHITYEGNSIIKFRFYGTKLRYISDDYLDYSKNISIKIDDYQEEFFNQNNDQKVGIYQCLLYEKQGLPLGVHYVTITIPNKTTWKAAMLDAIDIDADGKLLPYYQMILNVEPEKEKINLNENITANITIDNIKEIAAEDIRIKYDSSKLQFLGAEQVDGIKVVKDEESDGELRVILASQGKANIANTKKTLLKLNFKGIAVGEALVDITKGRISDGITMERDLADEECGEATIIIEDYKDPNKDGEFTLLDLAIDGRHYGENPADLPEYKTDVVENGAIDDEDLIQIGKYMLENPNYTF